MDFSEPSVGLAVSLGLLLLIGMGPKIALVPFLEKTKDLDAEKKRQIGTRMVTVGVVTALVLYFAGAALMRLLHISGGAVSIAGGLVLMLLALKMAAGPGEPAKEEDEDSPLDHHQMAVYPLAIPYLLNPVGITVLIIASDRVETVAVGGMVVGLVLLIGLFDFLIFRNIDVLAKRMRPSTLVISEVVFGILLTAVAIELILSGANMAGLIDTGGASHH